MSPLRFCLNGGLLVGGEDRLPTDPCEWGVGCNRLHCSRCQAMVRSLRGVKLYGPADPAKLYASEDWTALPFTRPAAEWRLYACKCQLWEATSAKYVENDHDSGSDPDVSWTCAGHETPALPVQLGELTVGEDTDWPRLVGRVLDGTCPRRLERAHEGPVTWLAWLYSYFEGLTALQDSLSSAIAARIDDADPQVVGRVLYFFTLYSRVSGVERLIARAETAETEVAVGHPIPEAIYGPKLWDVLIAFLGRRTEPTSLDQRAAKIVRAVLLLPLSALSHRQAGPMSSLELERLDLAKKGWKEAAIARVSAPNTTDVIKETLESRPRMMAFDNDDLLFIAENAPAIAAGGTDRWQPLMTALVRRYRGDGELGHLIVIAGIALLQGGNVERSELRAWMKKNSYSADEWVLPLEVALDEKK